MKNFIMSLLPLLLLLLLFSSCSNNPVSDNSSNPTVIYQKDSIYLKCDHIPNINSATIDTIHGTKFRLTAQVYTNDISDSNTISYFGFYNYNEHSTYFIKRLGKVNNYSIDTVFTFSSIQSINNPHSSLSCHYIDSSTYICMKNIKFEIIY